MADTVYNQFKTELMNGTYDLEADTVKVALVDNTYTIDPDVTTGWNTGSDPFDSEISGTGYTAGGVTLASKAVTQENAADEGKWDAADVSWSSATFTARYAVIWDDTPTSPANPLILVLDFGADRSVTSGTFTIAWHADGIVNIN